MPNRTGTSADSRLTKFGVPDPPDAPARYVYGDVYEVHDEPRERLVIGPGGNQTSLLFELAGCWQARSFWLLYVLVVARGEREPGRYQSPDVLDSDELRSFLERFGAFLEQDGRHTFWIGSPAGEGTLVYDRHDVIYAYGPLDAYREVLDRRGFVEGEFSCPHPHMHWYHAAFDPVEEQLFSLWQWEHFPLRDDDDD